MTAIERPFAARIAIILNNAAKKAALAVRQNGRDVVLDSVLSDLNDDLLAVYVPAYTRISKIFGDRLLNAFKSHADYETKADDLFADSMELWIRATAAERVVMVSNTTKRMIREVIDDGFADELTGAQVAKNIVDKTGGVIARNRAVTISRTETHMAAQHASLEAAKSTGIPMRRVWIAAADERTRENHTAEDSNSHAEPVGMNEPFRVTGLMYPGDPGGDPAETIQCRCAVGYVTD